MSGPYPRWQPAPPFPPFPPLGWARLVVDCSYNPLGVVMAAAGPSVYVDGAYRGWTWGATVVDLPAGQHHLHVHTRYLGQIGKADLVVSMAPGQVTHLYYRAPATVFSKGRLAPVPHRSGGARLAIGILASSVLVVLLVVAIALGG